MLKLRNVSGARAVIDKDSKGNLISLARGESIEITKKNSDLCRSLNENYPESFIIVDENEVKAKPKLPEQEPKAPAVAPKKAE